MGNWNSHAISFRLPRDPASFERTRKARVAYQRLICEMFKRLKRCIVLEISDHPLARIFYIFPYKSDDGLAEESFEKICTEKYFIISYPVGTTLLHKKHSFGNFFAINHGSCNIILRYKYRGMPCKIGPKPFGNQFFQNSVTSICRNDKFGQYDKNSEYSTKDNYKT